MFKNKTRLVAIIAVAATFALPLLAVSSAASAAEITINWKGVTFDFDDTKGNAEVDSNDHLVLTPSTNNFSVHTNRIPDNGNSPSFINANNTPFITFSYFDTGIASEKIDVTVQDEPEPGAPRAAAGSLFSKSKVGVGRYTDQGDNTVKEEYSFFEDPRANVEHSVLLGHEADGTFYFGIDGEQKSTDFFKDQGIDFDFNDVAFRARNANGSTIRFTDFGYGDNFTPNAQAVPEPGSLAMLGLGGILLLFFGRGRRSRG